LNGLDVINSGPRHVALCDLSIHSLLESEKTTKVVDLKSLVAIERRLLDVNMWRLPEWPMVESLFFRSEYNELSGPKEMGNCCFLIAANTGGCNES
jgi:hypothetical protein